MRVVTSAGYTLTKAIDSFTSLLKTPSELRDNPALVHTVHNILRNKGQLQVNFNPLSPSPAPPSHSFLPLSSPHRRPVSPLYLPRKAVLPFRGAVP